MGDYVNIPSGNTDPNYRYRMPRVQAKVEGKGNGIKTNIMNMGDICKALERPPEYGTKFCGCEVGSSSQYNAAQGTAIINGQHRVDTLQGLIDKFIEKFVLCPKCRLPEATLFVKKKELKGSCKACGEEFIYDNAHKVASYIVKRMATEAASSKASKKEEKRLGKKKEKKAADGGSDAEATKEDKGDKEISSLKLEEVFTELKETVASEQGADDPLEESLRKMTLTHGVSEKDRLNLGLMSLFETTAVSEATVSQNATSLKRWASSMRTSNFLELFERFALDKQNPPCETFGKAIFWLYDCEIVSSEDLLDYYRGPKMERRMKKSDTFRRASEASNMVLDWLEKAGSGSSEEESDEE